MKKSNKKGFTIVELVIVIAVIAILAAVLIPTFSGLVEKSKVNSAMQAAKNAYTNYLTTEDSNGKTYAEQMDSLNFCIESDGYYFHVVNGQFQSDAKDVCNTATGAQTAKVENGVLTVDATNHTHS